MRIWAGLIGLGLMAGGCMPTLEEEEAFRRGKDARFTCDAAKVQSMIGQVATQALGGEAVRTAGARTMRWIAPDSAYTMDYRTDRLNVHVDARNRITKINCG
jgi:hypothetical protein